MSSITAPNVPPNTAFQPTPLRGPKIGGILQSCFMLTLVPIYTAARLNAGRSAAPFIPVPIEPIPDGINRAQTWSTHRNVRKYARSGHTMSDNEKFPKTLYTLIGRLPWNTRKVVY
jgi:hypothetical protein